MIFLANVHFFFFSNSWSWKFCVRFAYVVRHSVDSCLQTVNAALSLRDATIDSVAAAFSWSAVTAWDPSDLVDLDQGSMDSCR